MHSTLLFRVVLFSVYVEEMKPTFKEVFKLSYYYRWIPAEFIELKPMSNKEHLRMQ